MVGRIRRAVVCRPETAGWPRGSRWQSLGYFHTPNAELAKAQHHHLVEALTEGGAEVLELGVDEGLSLDAVYTHDASFPTDRGMILMSMGKRSRRAEPLVHRKFFARHDIPVLGEIEPPGLAEGGDLVWLDERTVLAGEGYRTNASGIEQLKTLLAPLDVEVVTAPLPFGPGPDACLHLMSLISMLDDRVALVDLPWLSVATVSLLEDRGIDLLPIDDNERDSLACNVLALGEGKLLSIAENPSTNRRLEEAGFSVATFPGSEICANGSGGPTCLTRPVLRSGASA